MKITILILSVLLILSGCSSSMIDFDNSNNTIEISVNEPAPDTHNVNLYELGRFIDGFGSKNSRSQTYTVDELNALPSGYENNDAFQMLCNIRPNR